MHTRIAIVLGGLVFCSSCRCGYDDPEKYETHVGEIPGTACSPLVVSTTVTSKSLGVISPKPGFLMGFSDPNQADTTFDDRQLVERLHPTHWGVSDAWQTSVARSFGASVTYSVFHEYAGYNPKFRPSKDFPAWEAYVRKLVQDDVNAGKQVAWWDIWGEPFAGGESTALIFETFKRAHDAIRSVDPQAKLSGPNLIAWNEKQMVGFMDYLVENKLTFQALGWHEFGRPEEFVTHMARFRQLLAERPSLGNPQVHINEYENYFHSLVPGYALFWLEVFEQEGVSQFHRACWNLEEGWSTCWRGLNGLLMEDTKTPQSIYWVYQQYAEMKGQRLETQRPDGSTLLAARDDDGKELRVLVGRPLQPGTAPRDMAVTIETPSWAPSALSVDVKGIPYTNGNYGSHALPQMESHPDQTLTADGGVVVVALPCVAPGEVRTLVLRPQ